MPAIKASIQRIRACRLGGGVRNPLFDSLGIEDFDNNDRIDIFLFNKICDSLFVHFLFCERCIAGNSSDTMGLKFFCECRLKNLPGPFLIATPTTSMLVVFSLYSASFQTFFTLAVEHPADIIINNREIMVN